MALWPGGVELLGLLLLADADLLRFRGLGGGRARIVGPSQASEPPKLVILMDSQPHSGIKVSD